MSYHQQTWDLFGMSPRQSPVAHEMLDRLEHERDVTFPAAVREWYATVWAHDLFTLRLLEPEYILDTPLSAPAYILNDQVMGGQTTAAYRMMYSPYWAGNLTWAVALDPAIPNPHVYVSEGGKPNWMDTGSCFSEMIFAALWDIEVEEGRYEHSGRIEAAPSLLLPTLTDCYRQLPSTTTPHSITHRLQGDGLQVILLYFPVQGMTTVILYADALDPIRQARQALAPFEDIRWNRIPGLSL